MGMQGDFFQLLKEQGYQFGNPVAAAAGMDVPTATTILALKYRDGVLVAGDRRATAGNMAGDRSPQRDGHRGGAGDGL